MRLLAIIPEDGWALVRDGDLVFVTHPPFQILDRVPFPQSALDTAVSIYGYEPQPDAPEEDWSALVERIREHMVRAREPLPSCSGLLARVRPLVEPPSD